MNLVLMDYLNIVTGAFALALVIMGYRGLSTGRVPQRVRGPLTPAEAARGNIWMGVSFLLLSVGGLWSRHTSGDTATFVGIAVYISGFIAFGVAVVLIVRALLGGQRQKDGAAGR